jgi:hypothetical protein
MSKQKKVKAPERERSNSGNVMRAVATSIEFIKSQIVNDLLEAKNKNLINLENDDIRKLASIVETSISSSFIKTSGQIESSL